MMYGNYWNNTTPAYMFGNWGWMAGVMSLLGVMLVPLFFGVYCGKVGHFGLLQEQGARAGLLPYCLSILQEFWI